MSYEPKPGDIAVFPNKYHEAGDNKPNGKGYLIAHRDIKQGEKLEVALWTKTSDKGKFQAGKVSDFRQREESQQPRPVQHPADDVPPFDDSVPF